MARIRSIHPGAPIDEDVATMSWQARLTWAYLPCHADREGRLKDAPFSLKLAILPTDDVDMVAVLDELERHRHIVRYEVDGRRFLRIRSFLKYQTPHAREASSTIPGDPEAQPRQCLPPPLAVVGPGKAMASPPDPDPGPGPEKDQDQDPEKDQKRVRPSWSAGEWLKHYGRAWAEKYQQLSYGNTSDAKACGTLADFLDRLTPEDRAARQARAGDMISEFLADEGPGVTRTRHPFTFFVTAFGGLGVAKARARAGSMTADDAVAQFLGKESSG